MPDFPLDFSICCLRFFLLPISSPSVSGMNHRERRMDYSTESGMNQEEIQLALDEHNRYRRLEPASNMQKLVSLLSFLHYFLWAMSKMLKYCFVYNASWRQCVFLKILYFHSSTRNKNNAKPIPQCNYDEEKRHR